MERKMPETGEISINRLSSGLLLAVHIDNDAAPHLAGEDIIGLAGYLTQRNLSNHGFEFIGGQILGKPRPGLNPAFERAEHRIDSQEVDAAQEKRNDRGL